MDNDSFSVLFYKMLWQSGSHFGAISAGGNGYRIFLCFSSCLKSALYISSNHAYNVSIYQSVDYFKYWKDHERLARGHHE